MMGNQIESFSLEQKSVIKFYGSREVQNHVKFMEVYVMGTEKHVLVKKMLTNGINIGLSQRAWREKTVHGVEAHWLTSKKKFWAQQSVKKVILILFTQPLHSGRIWHKVNFFKRSLRGLNSEFTFS